MKVKKLKLIETLSAALLLSLILGCGQSKQPEAEAKVAAPEAPATPAATPAPATPDAPATPATPQAAATPAATPPPAAPATGLVTYNASPTGSKMRMDGTSTIHDWDMESTVLGGSLEADASFPAAALTDPKIAEVKAQVFMPVRSFKSNNKKMDSVMQEHMKETQFKKIEYVLTSLKPKSAAGATGPLEFEATGALTVAGKTNTIVLPVTIEKVEGTKLKIKGTAAVKMTDYGVEPPAPKILGVSPIKTGDDLKLSFEWVLVQKAQ